MVFDEFLLDVGYDPPAGIELDRLRGPDLLPFAEIPPVEVPAVPIEVHVAEKLHAYRRVYGVGSVGSTRSRTSSTWSLSRPRLPWTQGGSGRP